MRRDPIAATYARALIEVAAERRELDAVLEEVDLLLRLFREQRDFRTFILTPSIERREKKAALDRMFTGKLTRTLLDFLQLVVSKGRQIYIEQMLETYRSLHDERLGRVHVKAVTAVPMSQESLRSLVQALEQGLRKTIIPENVVRPQIIGGLVIRHGDLVVDGSVRTHLERVASRMNAVKLGGELVHEG